MLPFLSIFFILLSIVAWFVYLAVRDDAVKELNVLLLRPVVIVGFLAAIAVC